MSHIAVDAAALTTTAAPPASLTENKPIIDIRA